MLHEVLYLSLFTDVEDELPTINPPKRRRGKRRSSKANPPQSTIEVTSPGQDAERLSRDFPLHNWLENKINELQRNKPDATGKKPYQAGVGSAGKKPRNAVGLAVGDEKAQRAHAARGEPAEVTDGLPEVSKPPLANEFTVVNEPASPSEPPVLVGDCGNPEPMISGDSTGPSTIEKDPSGCDIDSVCKLVISDVCGGVSGSPFNEQHTDASNGDPPLPAEPLMVEPDNVLKPERKTGDSNAESESALKRYVNNTLHVSFQDYKDCVSCISCFLFVIIIRGVHHTSAAGTAFRISHYRDITDCIYCRLFLINLFRHIDLSINLCFILSIQNNHQVVTLVEIDLHGPYRNTYTEISIHYERYKRRNFKQCYDAVIGIMHNSLVINN